MFLIRLMYLKKGPSKDPKKLNNIYYSNNKENYEVESNNYKKKINDIDAMLMAAGKGKRMRHFTKFMAKPLIKINKIRIFRKTSVFKFIYRPTITLG